MGDLIRKKSREVVETGAETSSGNVHRAERRRLEKSHLFVRHRLDDTAAGQPKERHFPCRKS